MLSPRKKYAELLEINMVYDYSFDFNQPCMVFADLLCKSIRRGFLAKQRLHDLKINGIISKANYEEQGQKVLSLSAC